MVRAGFEPWTTAEEGWKVKPKPQSYGRPLNLPLFMRKNFGQKMKIFLRIIFQIKIVLSRLLLVAVDTEIRIDYRNDVSRSK